MPEKSIVKAPPKPKIKLNTRLLPILIALLLFMQLTFPFKGWSIMLVGLGGLWLVGFFWAQFLAQSLSLTREIRFGWAHVGDRLEERFTLSNIGPVSAIWAEITDHSTLPGYNASRVTGIDRDSKNRWYTQGVCNQRGIFTLGPTTLRTGDPFGLYTVSLHYPESSSITVTPPIVPLPAIEVAPGGRAGEGQPRPNAFERTVSSTGVRDYIPGDNLSWVHWPTTARQGSLFIRLFDSMPSGDWWLFLDLDQQVQVGQGASSTEEHGIILAASLADRGLRSGRAVGLITHGQKFVWLPPQGHDYQRREIMEALALIKPGPLSLAELLIRTRLVLDRAASLIIITASTSGVWVEALLPLLRRGAVATVLLLDPLSFADTVNREEETISPEVNSMSNGHDGLQSMLTNLGVTNYLITRDLLDRPEARPGQQGKWEWHISPSGRAIPAKQQPDLKWKELA